jgi:hypothetical protein
MKSGASQHKIEPVRAKCNKKQVQMAKKAQNRPQKRPKKRFWG